MLFHCMRADYKKLRRLPVKAAHVMIPIGVAAVFLVYYAYVPWEYESKIEAFYQVLAMGFPFLIGVFTAVLADQELSAGMFQNMLSARRRTTAFFSKLLLLILFGTGAVMLASVLFGTGFHFLSGERETGIGFHIAAAILLPGGNVFLYVIHFILAFALDKGVTVGVGIVESLLSALLMTGMGEGVWPFVPAAWGSRLVTLFLQKCYFHGIIGADGRLACRVCALATLGSIAVFSVWSCRWDGAGKDNA